MISCLMLAGRFKSYNEHVKMMIEKKTKIDKESVQIEDNGETFSQIVARKSKRMGIK